MICAGMSGDEETYCRLCAEPTPEEQLIKSDDDVAISSKINKKMLWINIDVSASNRLPKTICFSCFDLLEKTWKFLQTVRTAQQTLDGIYSKKTIADCEVKSDVGSVVAGKPLDKNWETFAEEPPKPEVKIEVQLQSLDEIACIDPNTLLNYALEEKVKVEPNNSDDQACYNDDASHSNSDSDQPLLKVVKSKTYGRKSKKKKRKKVIHYEEEIDPDDLLPNPNAEAIVLDMSMCYITWADYTWRCANCDAQCKSIASLRLHSLEIHSCCCVFKCSDCDKIITNHKAFISHVRMHHNSLRYSCEFCTKTYTMLQYVKKHKNLEHRNFAYCQNCGATFDSSDQLRDHILTYAKGFRRPSKKKREAVDKDLKCEHCSKEFKSLSNLRVHTLVHLDRSREFSCHVCGKMFFTKGALSTHMAVHEDAKPYKCEFCQMAFRARGNLISHVSLHSGTKPFVCEQCGKSFRVKRHLKSHSIVHTDLMPFVCQYCKKAFRFKTRLNLHLRQHTGLKPYMCLYCQRDFTNGSNYKKHMKRRHNIDTSKRKYTEKVPVVAEPIELDLDDSKPQ